MPRPFRYAECFALIFEQPITAAVLRLLQRRRPPTIRRLIIALRIDAIERHACRTLAHISKKIVEIGPAFTYGNTPSAVTRKVVMRGIEAPGAHCDPRCISPSRGLFVTALSVTGGGIYLEASARLGVARFKHIASGFDLLSALAFTNPVGFAFASFGKAENVKAGEALSG